MTGETKRRQGRARELPQVRRTLRAMRRFASTAVVLALGLGIVLPLAGPPPAHASGREIAAFAPNPSATPVVAGWGSEVVSQSNGRHGAPPLHFQPRRQDSATAENSSSPYGMLADLSHRLHSARAMLLLGLALGSWIALAQEFMSRASRTRGQPSPV